MGRANHIYVDYGTYTHHGIDCGDGTAIHYRKSNRTISRTSMAEFTNGKQLLVKHYGKCDLLDWELLDYELMNYELMNYELVDMMNYWAEKSNLPDKVIQRAESRLGENGYCLFDNNCEHFATWCKTGNHRSEQVNNAVGRTVKGVGAASGLAAIGATVGGGMATGVAVVAAPAVAAAAVGYGASKFWKWISE